MKYDSEVSKKALRYIELHGLAPTHKRIVDLVGENRRVLDIGCATGYLAEAFAANGCRVTGMDMDVEAVQKAKQFCETVVAGDAGNLETLSRAGGAFDVIVCADILEHLVDPWNVLKSCRQILEPTGELIVSIPNIAYWKMRLTLLAGRFDYTDTGLLDRTHLRFFTVKSFQKTARDCGYDLVDVIINDAGLPGFRRTRDWQKLHGWMRWIVKRWPNLFVFHAIYRLRLKGRM